MTGQWSSDLRRLARHSGRGTRKLLLELADRGGWEGRLVGSGHIALRHVSGGRVVVSRTPSDWRALKNAHADIRRAERRH